MAESVGPRRYSCSNCSNNIALYDDIISKAFRGKSGRAFLFYRAMNVDDGAEEDKEFMTGRFTVVDICCSGCREVLGWKYVRAYEASEKYKEGKFVLEKAKMTYSSSSS